MWIINASLHGGVVTVQQGWGVLTHFVDIYHLFTSTEKMRGMFQFHHVVISLSLNDSAHNILNDVLKSWNCLVGSLLLNGFSDGFLVSIILSSVISPTVGMVMCFSSSQVSILHLQKDVLILFSCDSFLTESSDVFVIHLTNVFNMLFPCDSSLFTQKRHLSLGNSGCWRICCSRFFERFFCFKILQSLLK